MISAPYVRHPLIEFVEPGGFFILIFVNIWIVLFLACFQSVARSRSFGELLVLASVRAVGYSMISALFMLVGTVVFIVIPVEQNNWNWPWSLANWMLMYSCPLLSILAMGRMTQKVYGRARSSGDAWFRFTS